MGHEPVGVGVFLVDARIVRAFERARGLAQLLQMGQQELARMRERFDENIQNLVTTLVTEVAESYGRKAKAFSGASGGPVPGTPKTG